jgi:hypothetical protein
MFICACLRIGIVSFTIRILVVKFDKDMSLQGIYELNWEAFIKHKRWHSRMKAWNLQVSRKLIEDSKIIYQCEEQAVAES